MKALKNVSFKDFIDILVDCIMECKEMPKFYLDTGERFEEITQVDLMYGRLETIDDNYSEYSWEIEESRIYMREEGVQDD